jgi:hypothetical protein
MAYARQGMTGDKMKSDLKKWLHQATRSQLAHTRAHTRTCKTRAHARTHVHARTRTRSCAYRAGTWNRAHTSVRRPACAPARARRRGCFVFLLQRLAILKQLEREL